MRRSGVPVAGVNAPENTGGKRHLITEEDVPRHSPDTVVGKHITEWQEALIPSRTAKPCVSSATS